MNKAGANWNVTRLTAWTLVLLTLFHLGWKARTELRRPWETSGHRHESADLPCKGPDALAAQCPSGNVLLKIVGAINPAAASLSVRGMPGDQDFYLSAWYYRLNYELYPRRAWLTPTPTNIINNGWDVMRTRFDPDETWLLAHDVQSVVVLGFDEQGQALPVQKTTLGFASAGTAGGKNGGAP